MSPVPTRSEEWVARVLAYDPFAGDFGNGDDRTITDCVVVARRRCGPCRECGGPIAKGETIRVIKKVDSEGFFGGRICGACCDCLGMEDELAGFEALTARMHRP